MRILAVDDERIQLERLVEAIEEACPEASVVAFRRPGQLLEYLQGEGKDLEVDLAFMDNNMGSMSGLQLAKRVKEIRPDLGIMFVSGLQEFQLSPGDVNTEGFIMKPVTTDRIRQEIDSFFQHGLPLRPCPGRVAGIRCFGEFLIVNADRKPVVFGDPKAEPILAAIVMAGTEGITWHELAEIVSENRNPGLLAELHTRRDYFRMKRDLERAGIPDIFQHEANRVSIRRDLVDCDYYRFLEMDPAAVMAWRGQFMNQYPWANFKL